MLRALSVRLVAAGVWNRVFRPLGRVTFSLLPRRRPVQRESNQRESTPGIRVSLRSTSLTPSLFQGRDLGGTPTKGHPWPIAALAASMPLNPFHSDCVRPSDGARPGANISVWQLLGGGLLFWLGNRGGAHRFIAQAKPRWVSQSSTQPTGLVFAGRMRAFSQCWKPARIVFTPAPFPPRRARLWARRIAFRGWRFPPRPARYCRGSCARRWRHQ